MTAQSEGYARRASGGVAWMTTQKWFSRILGLLTVVILARLLGPADFGLVAVAMSVLPFVYLLADLGFSTYLVQAQSPRPVEFSTAFWYSSLAGALLSLALGLVGVPLEALLNVPGVAHIMWGLAPAVFFTAVGAAPIALLRRQLRFRALAIQSFVAGGIGQILAIVMAFSGFGVWALIAQAVVTQLGATVIAWVSSRWHPRLEFSWTELRKMYRYGLSVVAVEVVAMTRVWAENAIVAATLGLSGLGFLNIAQRLVQVTQDLTATAVTPVSMVVFAQVRADRSRLASAYARAQSLIYAIVIPAMVFVVATAPDLVPLMFGAQWGASVFPAQALAVAGILTVGASLDNGLFYGLGRPGTWFCYALPIDALTLLVTWMMAARGLGAVAVGFVVVAMVATVVRWPLVAHQLGVTWTSLALPFARALGMGVVVGAAGWTANVAAADLPSIVSAAITGVVVVLVWMVAVRLFLPATTGELWRLARSLLARGARRGNAITDSIRTEED